MARKDIDDRLVCLAYAYRKMQQSSQMHGPWPTEILMNWTGQPEKVCEKAMERADDHGLIDYGVSLRAGWLTDKGEGLLKGLNIFNEITRLNASTQEPAL